MATNAPCEAKSAHATAARREIDRRIERLVAEIWGDAGKTDDEAANQPRWIRARDLVERMQPFLNAN